MARLLGPVLLVLLAAAIAGSWSLIGATFGFAPDAPAARWGRMVAQAVVWLAAAWGLIRVLDVAIWHGVLERRSGVPVPRLLSDLVAGIVWVVVAMVVLAQVFALPVAALLTTSGVAIAIIGFALRDMIASLFSGIAINLERPYQIGDWIEVEPGVVGRVLEVELADHADRDPRRHRRRGAERAARDRAVPQLQPAASRLARQLRDHPRLPAARPSGSSASCSPPWTPCRRWRRSESARTSRSRASATAGVRWLARYWVKDYGDMPEIRYAVQKSVLRHLHHAGIAVPYPKRDLFLARMPERSLDHRRQLDAILARNELFADLAADDLRQLAERRASASARPACRSCAPATRAPRCSSWSRGCCACCGRASTATSGRSTR